ncbi:MAG: metallophosphoesterase [Candidatus Thermoplasmatota archaeon]
MKIFDTLEAIEPYPAVYIEDLDLLVIADLHLGYEGILAEQGIFMPKTQFKKIMKDLAEIIKKRSASKILINGDIKHEFSETSYHEFKEIRDFFYYLNKNFKKIILIKGNHDNFIYRLTEKYGVELYDEFASGDYLFIHGHKEKAIAQVEQAIIVLAHEHPAIALYTELGVKEKLKCFLYGEAKGKKIIVLPAVSYFAEGSSVNIIPQHELLSPILKNLKIDNFKAVGIIENEKYLEFPEIWKMKEL